MPPKTKKRTCSQMVKTDEGKLAVCGSTIAGDFSCPNRKEHMWKLRTGFCSIGACEGQRKASPSGRNLKTCSEWKYCPCNCHLVYDKMFAMSGQMRRLVDNSGYIPEHNTYWTPSADDVRPVAPSSSATLPDTPDTDEQPVVARVAPAAGRSFAPTATGRAARGELESWVKRVCDEWLLDPGTDLCTPPYVAACVAYNEGLGKEPSVGAIAAVWDRWTKLGFAVIAKKPARFVGYTDEGIKLGLDALKERAKRQKRMQLTADKRSGRA